MSTEHLADGAIVITGATAGIGRALALEFHRRGHLVYATGRDDLALAELREHGLRTQRLDVTDGAAIAALAQRLHDDGVRVHVLVNNAGYGLMGPLTDLSIADVRHQLEVNTVAPLAVTQALLDDLVAHGDGRIANIASVSGVLATPFAGAYCASKFALTALSDVLRMELAPLGVRVLTVQPGRVESSFGARAEPSAAASTSRYASISDAIADRAGASQRDATPAEDFARAAVDQILRPRPRPSVALARGGRTLIWFGRYAPARLRDRVLSRRFRLDDLRTVPTVSTVSTVSAVSPS